MKLSVIIVNYNVRYFLEQTLISVLKAITFTENLYGQGQVETIVVDNQSTDGSVEMVIEKFHDVRLIINQENKGFSAANNQAIRESKGEFVLLLNPDTIIGEDTITKCLEFMDSHNDAGGLGVKMIDGTGKFLPESKRGFPSPAVAFYKIFGLARVFPKSKTFGKYHLGYLPSNEIHEVDVLSGAFMMIRKKVLDKIGLLDETFFMYGEDIDLSYRIVKGGYKNYYFPQSTIVHYKGESTKKGSLNYVFVFYRAMVIFAKKHLPENRAGIFEVLINFAIYIRAAAALIFRMVKLLALPFIDYSLLLLGMIFLTQYWENTIKYIHGGRYPWIFYHQFLPTYAFCWIIGLFLAKGYQKPFLGRKIFGGAAVGTLIIAVGYAFLSEEYRFSRALIILGGAIAAIVFTLNRIILFVAEKGRRIGENKVIIAGSSEETKKVLSILDRSKKNYHFIGRVSVINDGFTEKIGSLVDLPRLQRIYQPNEIIFCGNDVDNRSIINWMERLCNYRILFRIMPEGKDVIIGSDSKNKKGDHVSGQELFLIQSREARLNKRLFDVIASLICLITAPVNIWFVAKPEGYLKNILSVISGKKTWVSYSAKRQDLPNLKSGVLSPSDELPLKDIDHFTIDRLDYLYAKNYNLYDDMTIFINCFSKLGNN